MRRIALAVVPLAALAAVVALSARGGQERSQLRIVRVASGLTEPVAVTAPPNESNNVYVAEKVGRVRRCTLVPFAFEGISMWLQRLDRFAQVVERTKGAR